MKLLVGLGNPGNNYSSNRHNIGFRLVDYLHEKCAFPLWTNSTNYQYSKGPIGDEQVILIKPSTFMNESGKGVLSASKFFKINCKDILIFHDDLNLSWGILKKKIGGGHGGHNGLRSVSSLVGQEYSRLRIGIGRPNNKKSVANYVLSGFTTDEESQIPNILDYTMSNITNLIYDESFIINGINIQSKNIS